jgi:hypothetical protein
MWMVLEVQRQTQQMAARDKEAVRQAIYKSFGYI